ncbi:MAG: hypothetical protein RL328_2810 [Acidobacteriota bacterium]
MNFRVALITLIAVGTASAQNSGAPPAQPQQTGVVSSPRKIDPDAKASASQRAIDGLVMDAMKNPAPRAIVQLKDMKTLSIRSFVAQNDGTFHFAGLKMDTDYELKATLGELSSETKRVSSFESRKVVTVNLQLQEKK